MTKTKVFIHVGIHKTGTTFLQQEIFPKIKNINYKNKVDLATKIEEEKINLFSDENLDGGSYRLFCDWTERYSIADNLKKLYPDAGIIVVLRDEKSWLVSAWKQYVVAYYGHSFVDYFSKFKDKQLDFHPYVDHLKKLFDNVLVLQYEDLINNPEKFVFEICSFIGVEPPVFKNRIVYRSISVNQANTIVLFDRIFKSKYFHFVISLFIRLLRNDPTIRNFKERKL